LKPYSSTATSLNRLMRHQSCKKMIGLCTAQCKMLLFYAKTGVKESHILN